jgi:chromosome partitioning protein
VTVIALANRKGGVGKTTLAVAIATKLAEQDPVLLIDPDRQANATESLGIPLQPQVSKWLQHDEAPTLISIGNLDVVPGDDHTQDVDTVLVRRGIGLIRRKLATLTQYRWIVLDCPPSLSHLARAAVCAADFVLCPTIPEYLSLAGVRQLVHMVDEIRRDHGVQTRLMGIQPNKVDWRTNEHKIHLTNLVRAFGAWGKGNGLVWPPLRQSIAIAMACTEGQRIWDVLDGRILEDWQGVVERVRSYG